jgi:16S rRNA processing protein RimM
MKAEENTLVVMGRIVAPYGVVGWLKVLPDTELIDGLLDYSTWWVGKEGHWQEKKVVSAKVHNDVLVVKLLGIDDRDAAFSCKGLQVSVPRALLPKPEENAYYWSDLTGLAVKNLQDVDFGHITSVFETGANDVIVVNTGKENGNVERLIPFIDQVVLTVDLEAKTMLVDWDSDF